MSKHAAGQCAGPAGHRTLFLAVTVGEEHYETAKAILATVRNGMLHVDMTDDGPTIACTYFGPLEVQGADRQMIYSLGSVLDGLANEPETEPSHARDLAIVNGARAMVGMQR